MTEHFLSSTPENYKKAAGDEWDEIYEHDAYYYNSTNKSIIKKRIRGRDNARDSSSNYEETIDSKVITENDLPADARIKYERLSQL